MYLTPLQIMNLISALLQLKPFNAGKVVFVISSNTVFGGIEFVGLGHRKNEKSETRLVTSACCNVGFRTVTNTVRPTFCSTAYNVIDYIQVHLAILVVLWRILKRIILTGKTVSRNETIKNHASKSKFHLYHVFLYDRVLTIKITEYIWSTFIWHPKIFNSLYDTGLLPTKPTERHAFLLIIFGNSHCYIAFYLCNSSSVAISSNRKKSENKLNRVWKIWLKFMGV